MVDKPQWRRRRAAGLNAWWASKRQRTRSDSDALANKTYTSSGSLTHIQIWNVTTLTEAVRSLSWNSRPQRIALMGTVAFLPEKEKIEQVELEDGWQSLIPTRFSCDEEWHQVTDLKLINLCKPLSSV
ncbi:hypothetical protein AZE42_13147 [Rhizopogon vesiculosus]|uniref:Uncharacterized protein n=1 Tax=Rhizopogon vesiculosus TaxID=180088 RepID=A0A1J8QVD3_9AGAM|nr:hypothetical protein AZE42_13147 [Rhizopogon vesiculosus]